MDTAPPQNLDAKEIDDLIRLRNSLAVQIKNMQADVAIANNQALVDQEDYTASTNAMMQKQALIQTQTLYEQVKLEISRRTSQ